MFVLNYFPSLTHDHLRLSKLIYNFTRFSFHIWSVKWSRNGWIIILFSGYGMEQPVGHVDFYPNGGTDQPGCSLLDLPVSMNSMVDPDRTADSVSRHLVACSHTRAINLYIESLNQDQDCFMVGHECPSYEEFQMVRKNSTVLDTSFFHLTFDLCLWT